MELHAPRVNTFVQIPAYGIEHPLSINFMLDTGSAHTIISPEMSSELGIQKGKPTCRVTSVDCSTKIDCVRLKTIIWFSVQSNSGEPERRGLETEILAEVGKESNWGKNDSLLGRDILQHFLLGLCPPIDSQTWILKMSLTKPADEAFLHWGATLDEERWKRYRMSRSSAGKVIHAFSG